MLQDRRRALHARIVDAIEALYPERLTEQIERLAHHAVRGELREKVHYLRQAGLKAAARSALQDGRAWFEQALGAYQLSGVVGWRLHDLRRTCVSGMARLGVAPHVADKILNHQAGTISGVAAVYQRHEFLAERRAALDLWGAHIGHVLGEISQDRRIDLKIVA